MKNFLKNNKFYLVIDRKFFCAFLTVLILFFLAMLTIYMRPVINIPNDMKVLMSEGYHEPKVEAHFMGKDLSKDVSIKGIINDKKSGVYDVIYSVKYKKLIKQKIAKIEIIDDVKPEITLKGDEIVYLNEDDSYEEMGYKAIDNNDGDITDKVKIKGKVNNKVGDYNLVYQVKDKAGNSFEIKRLVKVIENSNIKTIYLTFDDGPSSNVTPRILDILKHENVKATFFVVTHDKSLDSIIKREHDEGHTVALHSNTHDYGYIYESKENYFEDLTNVSNYVKNITNEEPKIIRFPGGSSNTVSSFTPKIMSELTVDVLKKGYEYFDWNIDSGDTGRIGPSKIVENVTSSLNYSNNVVLMHDYGLNDQTADALESIIKYGKKNGYRFSKITKGVTPVHHEVNN